MYRLHRSTRTAGHRPATPSALERQVQKELEGIPLEYFPIWGKTLGYKRYQAHFVHLSQHCEQGLLRPSAEGYTYEILERIECANIYCNRDTDTMQTRIRSLSTGRVETSPPPVQDGISNQRDYVPGQHEETWALPHPGGDLIQHWETAPYTMPDLQQLELYPGISSVLEYQRQMYSFTDSQQSMDTSSDATSGLDLHSPPNPPWDLDMNDQVHPYGHHWTNDPSPPPPRG